MKKGTKNDPPSRARLVFAENVLRARKEAGLTQEELRLKTGMAQSFISEVENALTNLTVDSADQLAQAFDKPLWEMFKPRT